MNYDFFPKTFVCFFSPIIFLNSSFLPFIMSILCGHSICLFPFLFAVFFSFIFLWIQSNSIFFYFPHENWLWINTAYFGGFMYLLLVCKVYFKDFLENNFELKESEESFSLCQSLWWFISEQIFSRVSIFVAVRKIGHSVVNRDSIGKLL